MNKDFVPYEESLELKELGFDEPCFGAYILNKLNIFKFSNDIEGYANYANLIIGAPTFSQAFRWFRVKHGLYHYITTHDATDFEWYVYDKDQNDWEDDTTQDTYEEAELACLRKLIEIVKQKV